MSLPTISHFRSWEFEPRVFLDSMWLLDIYRSRGCRTWTVRGNWGRCRFRSRRHCQDTFEVGTPETKSGSSWNNVARMISYLLYIFNNNNNNNNNVLHIAFCFATSVLFLFFLHYCNLFFCFNICYCPIKVFTLKYINLTKHMAKGSGYKFVNLVTALPLYK